MSARFAASATTPRRSRPPLAIAPPYDVISRRNSSGAVRPQPAQHRPRRVRRNSAGDTPPTTATRARPPRLAAWRQQGVLVRDDLPAIYALSASVSRGTARSYRAHVTTSRSCGSRSGSAGVVKPHEHTLVRPEAGPPRAAARDAHADQPRLLPVSAAGAAHARFERARATPLYDFEADGQRHTVSAITDARAIEAFSRLLAASRRVHRRRAPSLRDGARLSRRAPARGRIVDRRRARELRADGADRRRRPRPARAADAPHRHAAVVARRRSSAASRATSTSSPSSATADEARSRRRGCGRLDATVFVGVGLRSRCRPYAHAPRPRRASKRSCRADQPAAWKRLDVNVLQYGDSRGGVRHRRRGAHGGRRRRRTRRTRTPRCEASAKRRQRRVPARSTPVDQVLAVADAGGRMPQKSTYFYPKLPTGLVMYAMSE